MAYNLSTIVDPRDYETEGLCEGIPLHQHQSPELADIGAIRLQKDWRKHAGDFSFYKRGMGPEYRCTAITIPECLPDKLDSIGYIIEPAFLYDDLVDRVDSVDRDKVSLGAER